MQQESEYVNKLFLSRNSDVINNLVELLEKYLAWSKCAESTLSELSLLLRKAKKATIVRREKHHGVRDSPLSILVKLIEVQKIYERHSTRIRTEIKKCENILSGEVSQFMKHYYPLNKDHFMEHAFPFATLPTVEPQPQEISGNGLCCICQQTKPEAVVKRRCQLSMQDISCSGHECQCGRLFCKSCISHWYWRSTNRLKKSFATCPLCRAEFCIKDIIIYKL